MVDRYEPCFFEEYDWTPIERHSDGDYVLYSDYQRLEVERQRMINIASNALGFSEYQRDQDTVEVLAHHANRLAEELVKQRDKIDALAKALSRVTAYYEGALHGVTTDNYQDVLNEANAAIVAAKEK